MNFFATLVILYMLLFVFCVSFLLVGAVQLWRNRFIMAFLTNPLGADTSIIRSIIVAHSGLFGKKSRYVFNHIMSIALFLISRSSRLSLPSVMGFLRVSLAILGDELSLQMKFFIILFRVSSVSFGIS